jgi:hypothetical protein
MAYPDSLRPHSHPLSYRGRRQLLPWLRVFFERLKATFLAFSSALKTSGRKLRVDARPTCGPTVLDAVLYLPRVRIETRSSVLSVGPRGASPAV